MWNVFLKTKIRGILKMFGFSFAFCSLMRIFATSIFINPKKEFRNGTKKYILHADNCAYNGVRR